MKAIVAILIVVAALYGPEVAAAIVAEFARTFEVDR